jgi:predicted nucleotide-binding protein (sugar kinase/HSP70/actin superfamily)
LKKKLEHTYPAFTDEMKKDYTIFIPNMLPVHFKLLSKVFQTYGYNTVVLENSGREIADAGLKSVHNDTCYPALLVIGQFIDAIESDKYDQNKVALLITQTGGGCRASNYICLLRKALEKRGYGYIPVLSLNFSGLDKEASASMKITLPMGLQLVYSILFGDLIMLLYNQCKPYEIIAGTSDNAENAAFEMCFNLFRRGKLLSYKIVKETYRNIIAIFNKIERKKEPRIKVGIVGEIYVKYSPLGNNNLEDFLHSAGVEIVVPGLLDFCMYCVANSIIDRQLYGGQFIKANIYSVAYKWLLKKQSDMIEIIKNNSNFNPLVKFSDTYEMAREYISHGVKMGEGWLLTAEMIELIHSGANNIICTQPFGCLPNHIAGKGMMRVIKEKNPNANIVAIDYDPGATKINQENRIKLMLSAAKRNELKQSEQRIIESAAKSKKKIREFQPI